MPQHVIDLHTHTLVTGTVDARCPSAGGPCLAP